MVLSLHIDFIAWAVIVLSGLAFSLLFKSKGVFIVLLVFCLSFIRTGMYVPTKENLMDAQDFEITTSVNKTAEYEFIFDDWAQSVKSIPEKVIGERGAYVAAILFGDKSGLDTSVTDYFRVAGISHILAVSGLHVGIIVSSAAFCLKKAKKYVKIPVILSLLVFMAIVSGFSPSVLRASLMMVIYLIADTFGFRYSLLNSLFFAGTIILFIAPYHIFNVGFLLSFTSTLGIGLFYNSLYGAFKSWGNYVAVPVAMYIACQATSLPLIIYAFGEVSLLGLIGNIFAVPVVTFALISGMAGMMLYAVGLSYYIFSLSAAFMEIIEYISSAIGAVPFAVIAIGQTGILWILLYYCILALPCVFAMDSREPVYWTLAVGMAGLVIVGISVL